MEQLYHPLDVFSHLSVAHSNGFQYHLSSVSWGAGVQSFGKSERSRLTLNSDANASFKL